MSFLAGDLGGTKTLLGLYDTTGALLLQRRYGSHDHGSLESMVAAFLADREVLAHTGAKPPRVAAFGVAGPVTHHGPGHSSARITNLPWGIDTRQVAATCGIPEVILANDFYAVAMAAASYRRLSSSGERVGIETSLPKEVVVQLNPEARPDPQGALAILGAGTGLGEAFVASVSLPTGQWTQVVLPSEGGHADFAPRDEVEIDLFRFLSRKHGGHVSYERVLCGAGLASLYEFFCEYRGKDKESPVVRGEIEREGKGAPAVISKYGLNGTDPLCVEALDRFVLIYGAEAGNLALKGLCTGGVYVAGGIAPKILPKLKDGAFLEGYLAKGRFSGLVSRIPVYVIVHGEAGLFGAAVLGYQALSKKA